ncbi:hypothetical protein D3C81_2209530 [compost metagenome]
MLSVKLIRTTRRTALQCLRIARKQRRELMGIAQMKKRYIDGMIYGHEQSFPQNIFPEIGNTSIVDKSSV